MKQKSYLIGLFFTLSSFAFVTVVKATNEWTPMVKIPGIPTTGINLSTYLVGLYNFMLSVVGIVAVMMLILAGMRYITSAGNQGALTDAKSMAGNAIVGLLLALFSFVILKTINPDVLYLKKPGGTYGGGVALDLGACGRYTASTGSCQCNDGSTPFAAADQDVCHTQCSDQGKCAIAARISCIGGGDQYPIVLEPASGVTKLQCICADQARIEASAAAKIDTAANPADTCEKICGDITGTLGLEEDGSASGYHGLKIVLRVGKDSDSLQNMPASGFTVSDGVPMIYDFSKSSDCQYKIVHFAFNFNKEPTLWTWPTNPFPDKWCCMLKNPGCNTSSWAYLCELQVGDGNMCFTKTEVKNEISEFPMFKHTYTGAGTTKELWVAASTTRGLPNCSNYQTNDIVGSPPYILPENFIISVE